MNPINDNSMLLDQGISLAAQGKLDEAARCFEDLIRLDPNFSGAYVHLGRAYFRMRRKDDALRAFEAAVRINPNSSAARKWLGITLLRCERAKDAAQQLEWAIKLDPEVASTYLGLSMAYQALGMGREAAQAMKQAKRLNPEIGNDAALMIQKVDQSTNRMRAIADLLDHYQVSTWFWRGI